jgi:serine/threonine protein kinase
MRSASNTTSGYEIDALCDEFERAFRTGAAPRIEDFLDRVGEDVRLAAFQELLRVEIELCRVHNQSINIGDYIRRFPNFDQEVRAACDFSDVGRTISQKSHLDSPLVNEISTRSEYNSNNGGKKLESIVTVKASREAFTIGGTLGERYRLTKQLGEGSFGKVFLAVDVAEDTNEYAIKIVEGYGSNTSQMVEAQLHSTLIHPHIVRLLDYFIDSDCLVLVLEYVKGGSLDSRPSEPWSAGEAFDLAWQMAQALEHAHKRLVVHRDLKPANVLVDLSAGPPRYILSDFGLARRDEGIQKYGQVAGSWAYMAPEQIRGRTVPQSDLWAVGVILYEILAGRRPFSGHSRTEIKKAILYDEPEQLTSSTDPLLHGLGEITALLLQKDLSERVGSAAELKQLLRELCPPRATSTAPRSDSPRADATPLARRRSRHRLSSAAGFWTSVAVLVAILGVIPGVLGIAGIAAVYVAERKRSRTWLLVVGVALCALAHASIEILFWRYAPDARLAFLFFPQIPAELADRVGGVMYNLLFLVGVWFVGLTAARFDRTRRELLALQLCGLAAGEKLSDTLKCQLDAAPDDDALRIRYARALVAENAPAKGAVEAQLALDGDPYNFEATLLLANSLLSLGHYAHCREVCATYLKTTPHCFEIEELLYRCS